MKIVESKMFETPTAMGNVPCLGVCVEANSYEEAKALAEAHFAGFVQGMAEQAQLAAENEDLELGDDGIDGVGGWSL